MKYNIKMSSMLLAGAAIIMIGSSVSFAGNDTDTFDVTATVEDSCTVTAGSALDFGTIAGTDLAEKQETTSIKVTCNSGAPYAVTLSLGEHDEDGKRYMVSGEEGVNKLQYELYSDSSHSNVWGPDLATAPLASAYAPQGAVTDGQQIPIYGKLLGANNQPSGAYTDTITATVYYGGAEVEDDG